MVGGGRGFDCVVVVSWLAALSVDQAGQESHHAESNSYTKNTGSREHNVDRNDGVARGLKGK